MLQNYTYNFPITGFHQYITECIASNNTIKGNGDISTLPIDEVKDTNI